MNKKWYTKRLDELCDFKNGLWKGKKGPFIRIRDKENLDFSFLHRYLHFVYLSGATESMQNYSTNIRNLQLKNYKNIEVPLLNVNEQKRIVAILDEAFAGIEKAVTNTEKNISNIKEIFKNHINSIFAQIDYKWKVTSLSNCSILISTGPFGSMLHKSDYVSSGVPLVNPVNIVGTEIIPDRDKLISNSTKERIKSYILKKGDIVIARRGEIGRCAVIGEEQDGWVCGTGCFFIRPLPTINSNFLANLIRSDIYRSRLEQQSTGTTMKNLSNKALSNLRIALPGKNEQEIIVNKIDELYEKCCNIESIYRQKLTALAELKQSLLQKAFSGELTAKDTNHIEKAAA